jgi:RNA polymerase sigma-70 factor (ECF subfamily)
VAISHVRRHVPDERLEPLDAHHLELPGDADVSQSDERLVALYSFIGQLDSLNRALILLYLEDRNYAEIAQVLGISQTNVATKLNRIKQKLRGQMTAPDDTARA